MTKIRATLQTSFEKTAEHKHFLKGFDIKSVSTSKNKKGDKFFCFTIKDRENEKKMKSDCSNLGYKLSIE